jgi:hypothetical protein
MEMILIEKLIVVQLIMKAPKLVNAMPYSQDTSTGIYPETFHNFLLYLLKFHFNIILQSTIRSPKWCCPSEIASTAQIPAIMP